MLTVARPREIVRHRRRRGQGRRRGRAFDVAQGQCYALLGPSGCGKTTTLRCVAGPRAGRAGLDRDRRTRASPTRGVFVPVHERSIGMVFQSYAIWPHLDVFDECRLSAAGASGRVSRAQRSRQRVMDVLALVGMETMARRPATRLSGGQQQRVALARAIVRRPSAAAARRAAVQSRRAAARQHAQANFRRSFGGSASRRCS